MKLNIKY